MLKFSESLIKGLGLLALLSSCLIIAGVEAHPQMGSNSTLPQNTTTNSTSTNSTSLLSEKQSGPGGSILYLAYNQTCSPSTIPCSPSINLVCSSTNSGTTGRCICAPGYVYVRDTDSCWPITKGAEEKCHHDVQCHAGKWGMLSRCSKHSSHCECYDYAKRDTVLVDGVCYIQKTQGDLCSSHEECDRPIKGAAYCQSGNYTGGGGNRNYTGSCQCRDAHTWYFPMKECLAKSTQLNDPCVVSQQCREGTLGRYSRCHNETARCECFTGPDNTTEPVYYKQLKKCFPRKAYNETCDENDECRASLGPDVVCDITEDYPHDKVCHCPKGKVCRSSGFSTILGGNSPYTMGIACTAAVIGMTLSLNGLGGGGGGMQVMGSGW